MFFFHQIFFCWPPPSLFVVKFTHQKKETSKIHPSHPSRAGHGAIFPPITTATSFVQANLGQERGGFNTSLDTTDTTPESLEAMGMVW